MTLEHPGQIDRRIRERIRDRRLSLGMTQADLAKRLGTTAGIICSYETGRISLSLGRLCRIAKALHTPVSTFFDDRPSQGLIDVAGMFGLSAPIEPALLRQIHELNGAYLRIEDKAVRSHAYNLICEISGMSGWREKHPGTKQQPKSTERGRITVPPVAEEKSDKPARRWRAPMRFGAGPC